MNELDLGSELIIVYRDRAGNTTKRGISRIQPTGDDAINAFCHLRGEWRTFKIAGIEEAVDRATGELIENPSRLRLDKGTQR